MNAVALFDPISSATFLKPAAKELGFKVVAVFTKPTSVFVQSFHTTEEALFSDCDEVIVAEEKDEILHALKRSRFTIKAAIAELDSGVELADQISHDLGLWGNSVALSSARRDKGAMRQQLKSAGLSCPNFQLCKSEEEALAFSAKHPFPLVIKTPKGAVTSQVYVCDSTEDLKDKFHDIMDNKDFFSGYAKYAVLEEYISGKEYAVNTFSDGEHVHVTDIWAYDKIDSPCFKNIYFNVIALPLEDPALKPLIEQGVKIVRAFDIERGPTHLEIKDDPRRGPTLIEINARLAGARMPLFLKEHSNFDPYKKTIEVFVNGKTEVPNPIIVKEHCAVALCILLQGGKIDKICGIDAIKKLASYEDHTLNIKPGDMLIPSGELTASPLYVFLAHKTRSQLLQDVEKAHSLFSVTFSA